MSVLGYTTLLSSSGSRHSCMSTNKRYEISIVISIFLLSVITPFALDGYTPSLPHITRALHASDNLVQLTMSLFLLGSAISQLFYGPLSDRFGRKKIILIGVFFSFAGSILCSLSQSIYWLIAARFLQGWGTGAGNSLFRAVMRDVFSGSRMAQVASYLGMVFTLALAIAPVMGGYFQVHFGWRAFFIFITILCAINGIIIARFLPETNANLNPQSTQLSFILKSYWSLLTHHHFIAYSLCSMLSFSSFMVYYTIGPFLLQNQLKLTPVQFGWTGIFIAGLTLLGQSLNAKFVIEYGTKRMLQFGVFLMLISGLTMIMLFSLGFFSPLTIILPILLLCISAGMVFSNAMAGAFHPFPHMAGIAGAMYGCLQILGSAIFTFIASILPPTQASLAITECIIAILAFSVLRWMKEK